MRILASLLLLALSVSARDTAKLIILHTNDLHGQLDPHPPSPARGILRGKPAGGYAHLATMVRAIRRKEPGQVLLLDAGDIFQGTPIGNETRGDAVIECMQSLGYHALALGNHEFDYGIENMLRLAKNARFPVLAANMSGEMGVVKPYVVVTPPGVGCKVAIIGLISTDTPDMTSPVVGSTFKFADPVATTRALVREIEADIYIALSHCGRDVELRLAKEVPELALVVGGHSHTPVTQKVGDVTVAQTHAKGLSLGRVDFELDPDGWKVLSAKAQLIPVDPAATEKDERVQRIIDKHGKELSRKLAAEVGVLLAPARRRGGTGSSAAGNWMSDVIKAVGKTEIGITNKGGLRADIESGKVTLGDIYRLMPFENVVVAMLLTGADIQSLVKRHIERNGRPGLEWSGMHVIVDERGVAEITVAGQALRADAVYRVATNSFLAWGGDGYDAFRRGQKRRNTGVLLRDAMARDLAGRSPFSPPSESRFRVLKTAR